MMIRGSVWWRRLAGGVVGLALLATVLAGCTSARSSLGTSDSSCFSTLPTASHAVGGHGHFLGVRLFTLTQLHTMAPHLYADLQAAHASAAHLCVSAYKGSFTSSDVSKPIGSASGALATVVVNAADRKLLATVVFTRLPVRFGHSH
jgi:hypothetical protein